jgi:hypothetical protein
MKVSRLVALAALALLASACGSAHGPVTSAEPRAAAAHKSPGSPAAAGSGDESSASSAPAGTSDATPSAQPSASAAPADCTTGDLAVSLERGDGAAGSVYWQLVMKNQSDHACTTGGFSGVSYVDKGDAQIGSPARWSGHKELIVLDPGAAASATLQETDAMNYPTGKCEPTPASGLRVYPPRQTDSIVLLHSSTACADAKVHLLTLSPLRAEQ